MTCSRIKEHLDEYVDGRLREDQSAALLHHLETCGFCRETLRQEREFRQNIMELPVPPLSPDFPSRVFTAAAQQGKRDFHRRSFITGFASAIAAGLALWIVTTNYFGNTPPLPADKLASVAISVQEVRKVKLVFDSARDLQQARVSIRIPESAELIGFEGQRFVSWQANLVKGKNLLALPIRALQEQAGALEAQIEHEGKTRILRLNLTVEKPGVSTYSEPQLPMV